MTLRSRARGFTLIEVLVALALMSLIGTILIESLRVAGHTWQRVTRAASNMDEISRAQDFLRRHLENLYPPPAGGRAPSSELLQGQPDSLEFSSGSPGTSSVGLMRYSLRLTQPENGTLEIRYRPSTNALSRSISAEASESLLSRVARFSVQYWDDASESPGHWLDHWTDNTRLPGLIRIDVEFPNDDLRRWPPLYVEPRTDTRAACVFDVVSRRCRAAI